MRQFNRAAWTSASVLLLLAVVTACYAPPPVGRPPAGKPPAAGGAGGRGGGIGGANGAAGFGGGNFGAKPGVLGGKGAMGGGKFGGGNFGGGIPDGPAGGFQFGRRTPGQVHGEIKGVIKTNPAEALRRLRAEDGNVVGETSKLVLAREAVEAIAIKAETNRKAVAGLAEVRAARSGANELPPEIRTSLERMDRSAERRVLAEGLDGVRLKAARGEWGETVKATREALADLGDARLENTRELESAEFRVRLAEAREALGQMQTQAARAEAVAGFAQALGKLGNKPAEAVVLRSVDRDRLPADLARQLDCLRGLAELRELTVGKWDKAPDVAAVRAVVERFERGLGDVQGADAAIGKKILMDVAVKAMLEGHPDAALKLLPENAPADHAAKLLRDLKALTLGDGKVETWPAKSAIAEPGEKASSPRPPPGLEPLVPEGARQGWKPPVKEKAADLPPIEQAARVGETVRTQAERAGASEKTAAESKASQTAKKLTALYDRVMAPELAERKKLVAVEAELDRRLQPAERVRVRGLLSENKTARQIAAELQSAPADDDEEKTFLSEVERRLGRPLDANERFDARRMRKQGRTSAEVADVMRR
jgi:hypothetical protein